MGRHFLGNVVVDDNRPAVAVVFAIDGRPTLFLVVDTQKEAEWSRLPVAGNSKGVGVGDDRVRLPVLKRVHAVDGHVIEI